MTWHSFNYVLLDGLQTSLFLIEPSVFTISNVSCLTEDSVQENPIQNSFLQLRILRRVWEESELYGGFVSVTGMTSQGCSFFSEYWVTFLLGFKWNCSKEQSCFCSEHTVQACTVLFLMWVLICLEFTLISEVNKIAISIITWGFLYFKP